MINCINNIISGQKVQKIIYVATYATGNSNAALNITVNGSTRYAIYTDTNVFGPNYHDTRLYKLQYYSA